MQNVSLKEIKKNADDNIQQCLTFMLGGKVYGLDILNIKEIIKYGEITEVPIMPVFVSGVINLRGSVVPVIDLSRRFSDSATQLTKRTSIIIIDVKSDDLRIEIGIIVDIVNEVLDIHPEDIQPTPSLGNQIETNFIKGMAKVNEKFLILLDIEYVLSIDEIAQMGSLQS